MKSFAKVLDWFRNQKLTIDITAKDIAAYCTIVPLVYMGGCGARDFTYKALGFKKDNFRTTMLQQYEVIQDFICKDTLERDVQYNSLKAILEYVPLAHVEDELKSFKTDCHGKWKVEAWKVHGAADKLVKKIEDLELFLGGEKGED